MSNSNQQSAAFGVIITILLCSCCFFSMFRNTSKQDHEYRETQDHKKAEVMRREGFEGTDDELARGADKILQLNEAEEKRRKERKDILGE